MTPEMKLAKAKTTIVLDHCFWASILLQKPLEITDRIPTACVTPQGKISVSPTFLSKLTVPQTVHLLCHEIGHVIGMHALRRGARNHERWNYAGDMAINDMLVHDKIGDPIEGGVYVPGSRLKTVDALYNELPEDQGGPGGAGQDIEDGEGEAPLSPAEAGKISAEVKIMVAQAAQTAKMQGKFSGALADWVNSILHVKTPWQEILERYCVAFVKTDYSWARPNRRFRPHYLPSTGHLPQMGTLVLQVDVSGSVSPQELAYYGGHFARIVETCHPKEVHVIYTDTEVKKHIVFEEGEEVKLEFYSGGGTHMPAGFDWVEEQGLDPDVFICLTDGYTDFGQAPDYPVIWCISSDKVADHGETVHFEME